MNNYSIVLELHFMIESRVCSSGSYAAHVTLSSLKSICTFLQITLHFFNYLQSLNQ